MSKLSSYSGSWISFITNFANQASFNKYIDTNGTSYRSFKTWYFRKPYRWNNLSNNLSNDSDFISKKLKHTVDKINFSFVLLLELEPLIMYTYCDVGGKNPYTSDFYYYIPKNSTGDVFFDLSEGDDDYGATQSFINTLNTTDSNWRFGIDIRENEIGSSNPKYEYYYDQLLLDHVLFENNNKYRAFNPMITQYETTVLNYQPRNWEADTKTFEYPLYDTYCITCNAYAEFDDTNMPTVCEVKDNILIDNLVKSNCYSDFNNSILVNDFQYNFKPNYKNISSLIQMYRSNRCKFVNPQKSLFYLNPLFNDLIEDRKTGSEIGLTTKGYRPY